MTKTMGSKPGRHKKKKPRAPRRAESADRHALYEAAVQGVEGDIEFFTTAYEDLRGYTPLVLREDFCGTAQLATHWCLSDPDREAVGIDLDTEVLDWARIHNAEPHHEALGDRLALIEGDVLEHLGIGGADIVCAMNFSYCVFHERATLARYLKHVREALDEQGLLILELYGGTEAIEELEEEPRRVELPSGEEFDYVWEQESFDPITHRTVCHIHFHFDDGSKMERAFTYQWRLWTIPELRDLLLEVGYSKVRVYFEEMEDDEDDDEMLTGSGKYVEVEEPEQQDSWLAYVVAER